MSINIFVFQFALIFLPGLLWARMHSVFADKEKSSAVEFFVSTFFYGLISYVVVFAAYAWRGVPFAFVDVASADKHGVINAQVATQIVFAVAVAFGLGVLSIYAATYRWLFRLLHFIRATKRYGSEDVWDFTFNSNLAEVEYVHVRDFDQKLVYAGWVNAFSETGKLRELTLRDVQVFDFQGALFYEVPRLYLARKPEGLHIEFPTATLAGEDNG